MTNKIRYAIIAFAYVEKGEKFCLRDPSKGSPILIRTDQREPGDTQENWERIRLGEGEAEYLTGNKKGKKVKILKIITVYVLQ